jgi:hypothetical protein
MAGVSAGWRYPAGAVGPVDRPDFVSPASHARRGPAQPRVG